MNNSTLVNDALRLIGVLPEGQNASAEDAELALRIATELTDEWSDDGLIVPWPLNASIGDDCPLSGTELTCVKYGLAVRLCPNYEREPSPSIVAFAASAYQRLLRMQLARDIATSDPILPIAEGSSRRWNILTDE
jgi:P22 tail accessory factor.